MYHSINPYWTGKKWFVDIQKDGVRKAFSCSIPRSEGKKIVRQKALAWLEGGDTENGLPFSVVFSRFLEYYKERNGENTSYKRFICFGKNHILPKLGNLPVGKITLDQYQACISQAKPAAKNIKTLSKKSLGAIRETLAAFMKWAKPRHYITEDFSTELYIPKSAQIVGKNILQIEHIKRWFAEPTGLWYEPALMFQLLVGFRPGEVLGLQISDYNPETHVLTINRALNTEGQITPGKNKNAHRQILATGKARAILEERIAKAAELRSPWIFCGKFGQRPSPQKYYQTFKKIAEAQNMPQVSPYCLRHTFYTLVEGYLPQRAIKTIFGHSDTTDSAALYGQHMVDGELFGISEQLKVTPLYMAAQ